MYGILKEWAAEEETRPVNGETDSDNVTGTTVLLEADGTKAKV